jgi:signal transduction histidine kinase
MESLGLEIALISLLIGAAAVSLRERIRRRRAEQDASRHRTAREATIRLLRLATGDQRAMALTLLGHAQTGHPSDAALTGLARRLLDLAENIGAETDEPQTSRYLDEELLDLAPVVEFAVAQIGAQLGPARRAWKIDPALSGQHLLADRRALNQVLVNVLAGAVAATRDGDWIEISLREGPEGVSLVVQDEGVGLPVAADERQQEGRGIGLRLTLARSLMQAHGGALSVVSAERVGTQVKLSFPSERLAA